MPPSQAGVQVTQRCLLGFALRSIPLSAIQGKIAAALGSIKTLQSFCQGCRQRAGIARGNQPARAPLLDVFGERAGARGDDGFAEGKGGGDEGGLGGADVGQHHERRLAKELERLRILDPVLAQFDLRRQGARPEALQLALARQDEAPRPTRRFVALPSLQQHGDAFVFFQAAEEEDGGDVET